MQNTPKDRRVQRERAEEAELANQARSRQLERCIKTLGASSFQGQKAAAELAELKPAQQYLRARP